MKKLIPTEYEEQCEFVDWLEFKGIKFTAIPNSTYTSSYNQKRKNYASGLRKGLPDLLIVLTKDQCNLGRSVMIWIEMKRQRGGKLSPEQKEWMEVINEVADVESFVAKGCDEAIKIINQFIK